MVGQGKFFIVLVCGAIIVVAVYRLAALIGNLIMWRGKEPRMKGPWTTTAIVSLGIEIIFQFGALITWAAFCPLWASYSGVTKVQSATMTWFYAIMWFITAAVGCWSMRASNIFVRRRSDLYVQAAGVIFLVSVFLPSFALRFFPLAAKLVRYFGAEV